MTDSIIHFDKVNKWYGNNFHVLKDIDLSVAKGERIVICGPSGSGKSTLIRCINRLEEHQQGQIIVNGTELTNDLKRIDLYPEVKKGQYFIGKDETPYVTLEAVEDELVVNGTNA